MQITDETGTRELESWEVEALEAAQKQHDEQVGYIRQYSQSKADALFTGMLANMLDLDPYDAVRMVSKFPAWEKDTDYSEGWRVRYGDELYTVLQAHTSQADWTPPNAPSLFAKVLPGQAGTEVGEWVQPDSTNPYMTGDRVTFEGKVYESTIDNNVYSPADYPAGWQEV